MTGSSSSTTPNHNGNNKAVIMMTYVIAIGITIATTVTKAIIVIAQCAG